MSRLSDYLTHQAREKREYLLIHSADHLFSLNSWGLLTSLLLDDDFLDLQSATFTSRADLPLQTILVGLNAVLEQCLLSDLVRLLFQYAKYYAAGQAQSPLDAYAKTGRELALKLADLPGGGTTNLWYAVLAYQAWWMGNKHDAYYMLRKLSEKDGTVKFDEERVPILTSLIDTLYKIDADMCVSLVDKFVLDQDKPQVAKQLGKSANLREIILVFDKISENESNCRTFLQIGEWLSELGKRSTASKYYVIVRRIIEQWDNEDRKLRWLYELAISLVEAGLFEECVEVIGLLERDMLFWSGFLFNLQDAAAEKLITKFLEVQRDSEAYLFAKQYHKGSLLDHYWKGTIDKKVCRNSFREAATQAMYLSGIKEKMTVLRLIAEASCKAGACSDTEEILHTCLQLAEQIEDVDDRIRLLCHLACDFHKYGFLDVAQKTIAKAMKNLSRQKKDCQSSEVIADIAFALARTERKESAINFFQRALALARQITQWECKDESYWLRQERVIEKMAEAGLYDDSIRQAKDISHGKARDWALKSVAENMLENGRICQFTQVIESIESSSLKDSMFKQCAQTYLDKGDVAAAMTQIAQIASSDAQASILASVADVATLQKNYDVALSLALKIRDTNSCDKALLNICEHQISAGLFEEVLQKFPYMRLEKTKSLLISKAIERYGERKLSKEIQDLMCSLLGDKDNTETKAGYLKVIGNHLAHFAASLAQGGKYDKACRIAEQIDNSLQYVHAMHRIICIGYRDRKTGGFDRTIADLRKFIHRHNDSDVRAKLLCVLARIYIDTDRIGEATRVLSTVCALLGGARIEEDDVIQELFLESCYLKRKSEFMPVQIDYARVQYELALHEIKLDHIDNAYASLLKMLMPYKIKLSRELASYQYNCGARSNGKNLFRFILNITKNRLGGGVTDITKSFLMNEVLQTCISMVEVGEVDWALEEANMLLKDDTRLMLVLAHISHFFKSHSDHSNRKKTMAQILDYLDDLDNLEMKDRLSCEIGEIFVDKENLQVLPLFLRRTRPGLCQCHLNLQAAIKYHEKGHTQKSQNMINQAIECVPHVTVDVERQVIIEQIVVTQLKTSYDNSPLDTNSKLGLLNTEASLRVMDAMMKYSDICLWREMVFYLCRTYLGVLRTCGTLSRIHPEAGSEIAEIVLNNTPLNCASC